MPKFYPSLSPDLADWLLRQPLFFVASAPLGGAHVNVSPKGHPSHSLAVITPNQAAYLDATGSGCETISHVYENGRVTLMACGFGTSPRILRLFCTGRVVEKGAPGFENWIAKTGIKEGVRACRAVIVLDIFKVQISCGFGVPIISPGAASTTTHNTDIDGKQHDTADDSDPESSALVAPWQDRKVLPNWAAKMERKDGALMGYWKANSVRSLDGCLGLRTARKANGEWLLVEDARARARRVAGQWEALLLGALIVLVPLLLLRAAGVLILQSAF